MHWFKKHHGKTCGSHEPLEPRLMMSADASSAVLEALATEQVIQSPVQALGSDGTNELAQIHDTYGLTGLGQTVVVIDSGVAYDHFALGGGFGEGYRVVGGWDFAEGDADPYDDGPRGTHGTHLAGILASSDETYPGVAPGADIVALRVFDDNGTGDFNWIESALAWVHENRDAFANPITAVNLSVGTDWHSDVNPPWAELEEELADLEADGIFVAAAAGNNFSRHQTVGLNYPATSPHVTPVGSVNGEGELSAFSQRHDRILVAPGELITSTIPDYINGFDGVTDDFGRSSGTSTAAPYIAGASVLVREAMQIAGVADITSDLIYEHLRATADEVYDEVTDANYLRVNLNRAIESALPADSVGDEIANATDVGVIDTNHTLEGWSNSAIDEDVFSFEAGESGKVTVSLTSDTGDDTGATFRVSTNTGVVIAAGDTLDVVRGEEYFVHVVSPGTPSQFQLAIELTPNLTPPLTVAPVAETNPVAPPPAETPVGDSTVISTTAGTDRIEIRVATNEIVVNGEVQALPDSTTNLVVEGASSSDKIIVVGTSGNDHVEVQGDQIDILSRGWTITGATNIEVQAAAGDDTVVLHDTAGDDLVIGRDGLTIQLTADNLQHRVSGFENTTLVASTGRDVAILHDGDTDDHFRFEFAHATMTYDVDGDSRSISADGFDRVIGKSVHGGYDRAEAYGSADAFRFVARPDASYLTGFLESHRAEGFDHVDAYAGSEAGNVAWLYDSVEDDRLTLSPDRASIQGGYSVTAYGYGEVGALGYAGGYDSAMIRDSAGSDTFVSLDGLAIMEGDGFRQVIQRFEEVTAVASSGSDRAVFYGSQRYSDTFDTNGISQSISNETRSHQALRFEEVSLKGTLTANVFSPGTHQQSVSADPGLVQLSVGSISVHQADQVVAAFGEQTADSSQGFTQDGFATEEVDSSPQLRDAAFGVTRSYVPDSADALHFEKESDAEVDAAMDSDLDPWSKI